MYIISVDLGSSNLKAVILKVTEDAREGNIEFIGRVRESSMDFALFIYKVLKTYDISKDNIEAIVVTGTGSSYLDNKVVIDNRDIEIVKVDEFDAIGYGGLILSHLDEGIVISIGTGTTIIYSDFAQNIRIGGTGLGGGTFVGLGNAVLDDRKKIRGFKELIDIARYGKISNVNLLIGDINKGNIGDLNTDLTAANFAALNKTSNENDKVAGIVSLVLENICLLCHSLLDSKMLDKLKKEKDRKLKVVFIGTMVTDDFVKECLNHIEDYTKDEYVYIDNADIAIAIGAYEYYLLRMRKV